VREWVREGDREREGERGSERVNVGKQGKRLGDRHQHVQT